MFDLFRSKNSNPKDNILSRLTLTLALVLVPEGIASAAGVDPLVGLLGPPFSWASLLPPAADGYRSGHHGAETSSRERMLN